MKIFFIGMPGSGKTTFGKQVATEMDLPFVDLDREIEARAQLSIPEIFSQQGEDRFRQMESALLHEWSASSSTFLMATGGGAPCFYQGIDVINASGLSIFLDVSLEELVRRVERKSHRPLLNTQDTDDVKSRLAALLEKRMPVYQQAKIIIQNPDTASILEKLRGTHS